MPLIHIMKNGITYCNIDWVDRPDSMKDHKWISFRTDPSSVPSNRRCQDCWTMVSKEVNDAYRDD